jgi:hypothetical protein
LELEGALSRNQKDWGFTNQEALQIFWICSLHHPGSDAATKDINVEPFLWY